MPVTTQCPRCAVVLNLPPGAEGKRLKCPHCGGKFYADQPDARPPSSALGLGEAAPASSLLLPSHEDQGIPIPTAEGDLRDTFDLPLLGEADAGPRGKMADAVALFRQEAPPVRRHPAQGRAQARRCPTCGGTVAVGMSICSFCGLDLDTGVRIGLEEELFDEAPAQARGQSLPLGIAIVGFTALMGSLVLALVATLKWAQGAEGFEYLALVCLFGLYASVQFVRGRSAKLLVVALSLGALVDILALVALPIYKANVEVPVVQPPSPATDSADANEEVDPAVPPIQPYIQRLDVNSLTWGIALLLVYAAAVVYLASPAVHRHFARAP